MKTQLLKIVPLEGFLFSPSNIFDSPIKETISSANTIKKCFSNELKNKDLKEIDSKLFLDTGLNINGKKIKKGILSITGSMK